MWNCRTVANNLFVPKPSIDPEKLKRLEVRRKLKKVEVFPVYRSPKINCLCPLPTGKILSIILSPQIKESLTFARKAILQPLFKRLLEEGSEVDLIVILAVRFDIGEGE